MTDKNRRKLQAKKARNFWTCARPVTQIVPNRRRRGVRTAPEHGWKTNCNLKHKRITAMIQTALKIDYIHMPQQNV